MLPALLAVALAAAPLDDRLVPVPVQVEAYEQALEPRGRPRVEMHDPLSFRGEVTVWAARSDGGYEAVAVRGRLAVRCSCALAAGTYEKLRRVWAAALDAAGPDGQEGRGFHFTLVDDGGAARRGVVTSAVRGTKLERLVKLGRGLADLTCAAPSARAEAERRLAVAADALLWWFEADRLAAPPSRHPPSRG